MALFSYTDGISELWYDFGMESKLEQFNYESSPIKEVYELLGANTPLGLHNKYVEEEQKLFISHEWDYDNPEQIQNKVKDALEAVKPSLLTEEEQEWRQEILWFWYHHAISCAIWKKDREKAIEYSEKALSLQDKDHPNKITRILNLLVNEKLDEAEQFLKTIETDRDTVEALIESYKNGKL